MIEYDVSLVEYVQIPITLYDNNASSSVIFSSLLFIPQMFGT